MPSPVKVTLPMKVTLEVGREYGWCSCKEQALCDDIDFCGGDESAMAKVYGDGLNRRKSFIADRTEAMICMCKLTRTPPFCDGSHKTVKDE